MKRMEGRIAAMERELRELKGRHSRAEAKRKKDEAHQAKIDDARRKTLAGTLILEKVQSGEIPELQFRKWLEGGLTESKDRALFGL